MCVEIAEYTEFQAGLDHLHGRIAARFPRAEVRTRVRGYLAALCGRVDRRNSWQMAEQLGEPSPRNVQRLLNGSHWDADAVRDDLHAYVTEHLGAADGVLIADETGFLKKGTKSVGVKRQYSGTAGRKENSQVGVFLAYASSRGRTLIDRALYLPQEWAEDMERRREAGVPPEVTFATKPELAQQMLQRARQAGIPADWVTADSAYGDAAELRYWLEGQRWSYVLGVSSDSMVWQEGDGRRVDAVVRDLPADAWVRLSAGAGSQGPRLFDWAWVELPAPDMPGQARWLLARRSLDDPTAIAIFRAYGPAATPLGTLVRVAGMRWAIEETIAEGKEIVGLDQYEVRQYWPWYRHITLCMLAHAYLEVLRGTTRKKGDLTMVSSH